MTTENELNEYYPDHILKIPNATPSQTDAAQYLYRIVKAGKVINYNLCGHFCVAFCMQDDAHTDNIDDFLDYWEAQPVTRYQQALVKNGLWRKTGIPDLKYMLDCYDAEYIPLIPPLTAMDCLVMLDKFQLILGVNIDWTGYLVGRGILHWIVLDRIMVVDNNHAIGDIFNPFDNAITPYSWRELMTSTGAYKQGLWIERV